MEITILIFLAGGVFLGWSLGANDAANVFGTAVGTRMVRFMTAAAICSIFVILGAVISGAGAAHTLGRLGAINAIAGSSVAAASAAVTVYAMTRLGLPVSTSQAIVGAIIGWNLFSGFPTDYESLTTIVGTWIACPILSAILSAILFKLSKAFIRKRQWHLLRQDAYTRLGLILAGAFGAYSLGANNIANVMGVFVTSNPFTPFEFGPGFRLTGIEQLFLIGGVAIAIGVFTYSKKVMLTVGHSLLPMSPVAAWVVVVAHSIVLLLFASERLEHVLASWGLPTIPLVPVSSSQAVIGGVIGIGILKGGRGIRWHVLGKIASGWVTTPVIAGLCCFFALFFVQNLFNQTVYQDRTYILSDAVLERLDQDGVEVADLKSLGQKEFQGVKEFRKALGELNGMDAGREVNILEKALLDPVYVDVRRIPDPSTVNLSAAQVSGLEALQWRTFQHSWQLLDALAAENLAWRSKPVDKVNKIYNKELKRKFDIVLRAMESNDE